MQATLLLCRTRRGRGSRLLSAARRMNGETETERGGGRKKNYLGQSMALYIFTWGGKGEREEAPKSDFYSSSSEQEEREEKKTRGKAAARSTAGGGEVPKLFYTAPLLVKAATSFPPKKTGGPLKPFPFFVHFVVGLLRMGLVPFCMTCSFFRSRSVCCLRPRCCQRTDGPLDGGTLISGRQIWPRK